MRAWAMRSVVRWDAHCRVVHLHRPEQHSLMPAEVNINLVRRGARHLPIASGYGIGQTAKRVGCPLSAFPRRAQVQKDQGPDRADPCLLTGAPPPRSLLSVRTRSTSPVASALPAGSSRPSSPTAMAPVPLWPGSPGFPGCVEAVEASLMQVAHRLTSICV